MTQTALQKIVILGPESTGKSSLCQSLAHHFNCLWVPEIAREYLKDIQLDYTHEDILNIAKLQYQTEQEYQKRALKHNHNYLFVDTEWITIKIWLEFYNFPIPNWLIEGIQSHDYDLFLLSDIDIAWQPDPLRQNKNDRKALFKRFEDELTHFSKNFLVINGLENQRFENSLKKITYK
jgi:NadR type nicotinamide-nucleotide adenylyltransferase